MKSARLRPASAGDAYALWLWANDPATRRASGRDRLISWNEHRAWLQRQLADGIIFCATTDDDRPLGCIRFESEDDWRSARLSYVVAPESRGQNLGRWMVAAGVRDLAARYPVRLVRAVVAFDNAPSLRVFRDLSWKEQPAGGTVEFVYAVQAVPEENLRRERA